MKVLNCMLVINEVHFFNHLKNLHLYVKNSKYTQIKLIFNHYLKNFHYQKHKVNLMSSKLTMVFKLQKKDIKYVFKSYVLKILNALPFIIHFQLMVFLEN